jgi:sulfide:quinone oxidoreductase
VTLRTGAWAETHPDRRGTLVLRPGGEQLSADRVVTLPRLVGRRIEGLPANRNGFLPVDPHARVLGVERVWAAGDGTAFPVKQGGVAAQQADAAAQDIAAAAGLDIEPQPLDPVLRGTLLTGDKPWHLRWAAGEGDGLADRRPLWWPPTKVAGRHLSPYLAAHAEAPAGLSVAVPLSAGDDATFAESDVVPFPGAPPTARA